MPLPSLPGGVDPLAGPLGVAPPDAEGVYDTTPVDTTNDASAGGKRFRKKGARGPGALVPVRMEVVTTGRDGKTDGVEHGEDEGLPGGVERAAEEADEMFEEAMREGQANARKRRR